MKMLWCGGLIALSVFSGCIACTQKGCGPSAMVTFGAPEQSYPEDTVVTFCVDNVCAMGARGVQLEIEEPLVTMMEFGPEFWFTAWEPTPNGADFSVAMHDSEGQLLASYMWSATNLEPTYANGRFCGPECQQIRLTEI